MGKRVRILTCVAKSGSPSSSTWSTRGRRTRSASLPCSRISSASSRRPWSTRIRPPPDRRSTTKPNGGCRSSTPISASENARRAHRGPKTKSARALMLGGTEPTLLYARRQRVEKERFFASLLPSSRERAGACVDRRSDRELEGLTRVSEEAHALFPVELPGGTMFTCWELPIYVPSIGLVASLHLYNHKRLAASLQPSGRRWRRSRRPTRKHSTRVVHGSGPRWRDRRSSGASGPALRSILIVVRRPRGSRVFRMPRLAARSGNRVITVGRAP